MKGLQTHTTIFFILYAKLFSVDWIANFKVEFETSDSQVLTQKMILYNAGCQAGHGKMVQYQIWLQRFLSASELVPINLI